MTEELFQVLYHIAKAGTNYILLLKNKMSPSIKKNKNKKTQTKQDAMPKEKQQANGEIPL